MHLQLQNIFVCLLTFNFPAFLAHPMEYLDSLPRHVNTREEDPLHLPENYPMIVPQENGDVLIKLEPKFAKELNDLIGKGEKCTAKRALDFNCISRASEGILRATTNDGPANELADLRGDPPIPLNENMLRAMEQFVALGASIAYQLNDAAERSPAISRTIFWLLVYISRGQQLGPKNIIPADDINKLCGHGSMKCRLESCKGKNGVCTIGPAKGCPCNKECPPPKLKQSCENCGQDNGAQKCTGLPEFGNLWQGCDCVPTKPKISDDFTAAEWVASRKLMANLPNKASKRPDRIKCDKEQLKFSYGLFTDFVAQFCKDFDLKIPKQKTLTTEDLSEDDHQENKNKDGKLDLKWSPPAGSQGCSDSCEKVFLAFVRDLQCSAASQILLPLQLMTVKGEFKHDCGTATYSIGKPPEPAKPKPKPPPFKEGTCRLKVQKWVNTHDGKNLPLRIDPLNGHDSTFSVKVEIFDSDGHLIGSHERKDAGDPNGGDRHEKAGPLSVVSKLEAPLVVTPEKRNREYVQFSLGDMNWPSNNDNGDKRASCTDGPYVVSKDRTQKYNIIDCKFECKWGGGKSSDGSN